MYIHIHFLLGALQEANPYAEQDRYGGMPRVSLSAPKAYSAFKTATQQQQQQKTTARSQGTAQKGLPWQGWANGGTCWNSGLSALGRIQAGCQGEERAQLAGLT